MSSIAIITDTDASLPANLAERYGIRQVPILIQFGGETLRTEIDIDDVTLFARVDREGKLPTTSAPSPGQFLEAYQAAFAAGADAIVCFCVSSAISATYGAAVTAAATAKEILPDRTIEVVDTRVVSMAQGFMALAAAEAAHAGANVDEVIAAAQMVGERAHLFGALSTLKYLAMSGRVGHLAAGFGNLLNVKPILTMRDGKLDLLEKVRTRSRVLARVVELAGEAMAGQPIRQMAVLNVAARDEAVAFEAQLRAALPCPETIIHADLTAGLSVHTGAGMLGVVVVS
jgi:DegV family protein with EDD domain